MLIGIIAFLDAYLVAFEPGLVEPSNRQFHIAEIVGVAVKVFGDLLGFLSVIGNHPWKHRKLAEIVVRAPTVPIQQHQVLEVVVLTVDPFLCIVLLRELLLAVDDAHMQQILKLGQQLPSFVFVKQVEEVTFVASEEFDGGVSHHVSTREQNCFRKGEALLLLVLKSMKLAGGVQVLLGWWAIAVF